MKRRMQPRQLKALIETEHYRLEPSLVAEAMLKRRAVRTLLMDDAPPRRSPLATPTSSAPQMR
jgi:hypothetical protein